MVKTTDNITERINKSNKIVVLFCTKKAYSPGFVRLMISARRSLNIPSINHKNNPNNTKHANIFKIISSVICHRNECSSLSFNFISNSPHGFDEFGMARRFPHFFSQPPDMHHHSIVGFQIFFSPYFFKQFFRGQHFSPMFT